ncbi:DUF803-domain-containing protein [Dissoconium aciculare CBS 342.82]|uniref:DUF803-domain-containing protein n=1 Tax=Dissoconium aciculare CBS 342.82 TaxID=1314786 RepID=A0A6J3LW01_9PEZI|nr:DUF803-domain-containing protein [Dissoconium aciculare CBS 342.82]KAF1819951.1 DUF803-domain-containing protein [Dissoconium aciculare CBS 342.82]
MEDKYVGLALAVCSTLGIGASFVITKKGLNAAAETHGFEGDGFAYLRNPIWWAGIITMVVGEVCNFSAYAFAPAILVTPLGALSVLIGAVLGSYFLGEQLGILGRIGCAICLIGSVVIVLHAPADEEVEDIGTLLNYALQPGFLFYCTIVAVFAFVMIYKIAPVYGKKNPMIFISICSSVGSISVMAIKGFGVALKLSLGGNNQFSNPSTYVFAITVIVCILTQMNYFNKALTHFNTNIVNPLYYVTFTTCTLVASFILFRGFNTTDAINTISLLCGFLTIFTGVYLLNLSREDPNGNNLGIRQGDERGQYQHVDGIPTDGLAGLQTRLSMQARRSGDENRRHSDSWSLHSGKFANGNSKRKPSNNGDLLHNYDIEASSPHNLTGLTGDSDDEEDNSLPSNRKRTSFDEGNGRRLQAEAGSSSRNGSKNSRSGATGANGTRR